MDILESVRNELERLLQHPTNDLRMSAPEPIFEKVLLGVAAADDPIWKEYKRAVGPFHWTPKEVFKLAFPELEVGDKELSILSWVLLKSEAVRRDNKAAKELPSERWVRARSFSEIFQNEMRSYIVAMFAEQGIPAIAPAMLQDFGVHPSENWGMASTWSERHVAHAAGLGTFALCDGLITPIGKAIRACSVIVRLPLLAAPRPYTHYQAYCLNLNNTSKCVACIKRCPVGALTEKGHDKLLCGNYLDKVGVHAKTAWDVEGYGCGLCQTGVPCESGIPGKKRA